MNKKIYSVSFPRTGTHFIGANLHRFYEVDLWVEHDSELFKEADVISVVREPRTNIASYMAHHLMRQGLGLNPQHSRGIAEASARDYLEYYTEAQRNSHVVFADFNLMTNDFIRFADQIADIFSLPKSQGYDTAEITRDDHRDDKKTYLPSVEGSDVANELYDLLGEIDLSEHYALYNENMSKAKENGLYLLN